MTYFQTHTQPIRKDLRIYFLPFESGCSEYMNRCKIYNLVIQIAEHMLEFYTIVIVCCDN